ncbi:hypothetical protein [Bacillus sp. S14(2024)]|uniref:hypothetical protein n=1 Tax=Bacillus sp. S14(2024) TaxID=3162884 RepID=UPI003D19C2B0
MEHSKLVAFSIQCNKCTRGWSLTEDDFNKPIIVCQDPECKNEFSFYEGVKNGLKAEERIFPNSFLANDMFEQIIEIKIGYTKYIELPASIKKIFKISIFPMGPFVAGATDIDTNGFKIYTSLSDESNQDVFGTVSRLMLFIHAKIEDYEEPWMHFLSYAYDHYQSGEYLTSIMMSEIAFESYIDKVLSEGYTKIGLDNDSISRFLVSTEMPTKVNPLMNNLYGIKLSSCSSWNNWEKKVLKWRNNIAHGTKLVATKEETKLAYDTVVDCIFHFIEGVDFYEKTIKSTQ